MGKFTILVNQQQQKTGIYMYFEIQMRNEFIYQQWLFSAGKFTIMFTWTDLYIKFSIREIGIYLWCSYDMFMYIYIVYIGLYNAFQKMVYISYIHYACKKTINRSKRSLIYLDEIGLA